MSLWPSLGVTGCPPNCCRSAATARIAGESSWREAKRAYERALFVLRTSRYREDDEFGALLAPARDGLAEAAEKR